MQSDRGVVSSRIRDHANVQMNNLTEKAKMRKTDTEFNSNKQNLNNSYISQQER